MMAKDNQYLLDAVNSWLSDENRIILARKWQINPEQLPQSAFTLTIAD